MPLTSHKRHASIRDAGTLKFTGANLNVYGEFTPPGKIGQEMHRIH